MALFSSADMVSLLLLLVTRPLKFSVPNAAPQPLPEAGAERTLEAVGCPGRVGGYPTTPPHRTVREDFPHTVPRHRTFPYGDVARLADNPRHPAPSALQHVFSRLSPVPRVPPGSRPRLSRSWAGAAHTPPSSDHTLATSSSDRPGDAAHTATRAS